MLLFVSFLAWYFGAKVLAASAAHGLALRFRMVAGRALLDACFQLFLLVIGLSVLRGVWRLGVGGEELTSLPRRATTGREWLLGAAVGWGIAIVGLLPLAMLGRFHVRVDFGAEQVRDSVLALATLAATVLAHEMTFRGFPFRCLTRAVGSSFAVVLMVLGAGISAWHHAWIPGTGIVASMVLTGLLSMTWLRTHAIWIAWGLHFALVASMGVLFGLPLGEETMFSALARGSVFGADWLSGGGAGPIGSLFGVGVLVAGIVVLYRLTRDYAWEYTYRPIVAAGAEVRVAPPAAHVAMEEQAAKGPALVQILSTTPTSFSVGGPDRTS